MQIQSTTRAQPPAQPSPAPARPDAAPADPLDGFVPSIPFAPAPPTMAAGEGIDELASRLRQQWAGELKGAPRCEVGILVERGWRPQDCHDEVLDIADAVVRSGGIPRLLYLGAGAPAEQMKGLQALAVPGGIDVDPAEYGQKLGPNMDPKEPDRKFDDFEIACIRQGYDQGLPMLGHCRGSQIMNVAAGGTLTEDIPHERPSSTGIQVNHRPEAVRHNDALRIFPVHDVNIVAGSRLSRFVGGLLAAVNSVHHQCIAAMSPILYPVAVALDGVVEGFQRQNMPWEAGYQFHPEALRHSDARFQAVYDTLVADGERFKSGQLPAPTAPTPPQIGLPTTISQF